MQDMHKVTVYGPGCVACVNALEFVYDNLDELGIVADVQRIFDVEAISASGVQNTPAISIDGEVKCSGRMPERDEFASWLKG